MMKHKIAFIIAGALLVLAAFMKFAMVGYGFLALVLCAAAAAILLFTVLSAVWRIVLVVLIAAFLALFCCWEARIVRAAHCVAPADADYLIVLGCGVRGTTPSVAMTDRTNAAAQYLKDNPGTVAICSGGQGPGEDLSEAQAMKKLICGKGIEGSRIMLEEKSTSTEENLLYSVSIIKDDLKARGLDAEAAGNCSVVICSSEYHIFRAQHLSADLFKDDSAGFSLPFPGLPARSTLPVSRFNYYLREAAGMLVIRFLR